MGLKVYARAQGQARNIGWFFTEPHGDHFAISRLSSDSGAIKPVGSIANRVRTTAGGA